MNAMLFAAALGLPIAFTLASMAYLRPILLNVLTEICGTSERAEFWIRSVTMLSLFGALMLVLAFGPRGDGRDIYESLRWILVLTLGGGFVGIAWVARTIWNSLMRCPETQTRFFAEEAIAPTARSTTA
ncbi:MAG TPA: hypothetical protein VEC35_12685 [Noviherbaspirillum sp.]|nr:hypothetical protein [Noviherbaspirillum sp.]